MKKIFNLFRFGFVCWWESSYQLWSFRPSICFIVCPKRIPLFSAYGELYVSYTFTVQRWYPRRKWIIVFESRFGFHFLPYKLLPVWSLSTTAPKIPGIGLYPAFPAKIGPIAFKHHFHPAFYGGFQLSPTFLLSPASKDSKIDGLRPILHVP